MIPSSQWNEAEPRYNSIDPLLKKAKWNLADRREVAFEVPVNGYDQTPENGITDYTLFRPNGEVLAVIEAKCTKRDARVGKEQLKQYLDKIEAGQGFRPFGFLANGMDIWFWDSVEYPERAITGFYAKENLEGMLNLQNNRQPLIQYNHDKPSQVIELGLDDMIESQQWVVLSKCAGGQKIMVEEYKTKVEARIQQIAGEAVSLQELLSLESTLELRSDAGLTLNQDNMLKAFGVRAVVLTDFLKYVLRLEEVPLFDEVVLQAFDTLIREHEYNADQMRFFAPCKPGLWTATSWR